MRSNQRAWEAIADGICRVVVFVGAIDFDWCCYWEVNEACRVGYQLVVGYARAGKRLALN